MYIFIAYVGIVQERFYRPFEMREKGRSCCQTKHLMNIAGKGEAADASLKALLNSDKENVHVCSHA